MREFNTTVRKLTLDSMPKETDAQGPLHGREVSGVMIAHSETCIIHPPPATWKGSGRWGADDD